MTTFEEQPLREITLPQDGKPDIRFNGRPVAHVSSARPGAEMWTELDLYETSDARFVVHEIGESMRHGHRKRFRVVIAADEQDLFGQLGRGPLAQELYDEAGLEDVADIDAPEPLKIVYVRCLPEFEIVPNSVDGFPELDAEDIGEGRRVLATVASKGGCLTSLTAQSISCDDSTVWGTLLTAEVAEERCGYKYHVLVLRRGTDDQSSIVEIQWTRSPNTPELQRLPDEKVLFGHATEATVSTNCEAWIWQNTDSTFGVKVLVRDHRGPHLVETLVHGAGKDGFADLSGVDAWLLGPVARKLMGTTYWQTACVAYPRALRRAQAHERALRAAAAASIELARQDGNQP